MRHHFTYESPSVSLPKRPSTIASFSARLAGLKRDGKIVHSLTAFFRQAAISLDLGSAGEPTTGAAPSNDPKWQEVATKLDLAKAYEEMGDKDGARELLNEVMKDGDAAQKGQAQQLLTKLG